MSYQDKVAGFKVIARDALRMELIIPRQSKIASLEAEIKAVNENKARKMKEIEVAEYELKTLDKEHPLYEDRKASAEKNLEYLNSNLPDFDKQVEEINKEIDEQKEGIKKIENGETKVNLDSLNTLVERMIEEAAINEGNQGSTDVANK